MNLRSLLISITLLLSLRTFQFFPGFGLIQEAWFILVALLGVPLTFFLFRRQITCCPSLEIYIVLLMLVTPVWAGLAALNTYGQPLIFGALSQRHVALLGVVLMLMYALSRGSISVLDLHRGLVALGWGTLALYAVMNLSLDAGADVEYGKAFIEDRGAEGHRFKFMTFFIVYTMFACFVRGWRERRLTAFVVAMVLFAYLVGDTGGRIFTAATALTLVLLVMRLNGLLAALGMATALVALVGAVLALGLVLDPGATLSRVERFGDAAAVFTNAQELSDPSAMARVWQTSTALGYIEMSPWFGSGSISYKWSEEGYAGVVDEYFYPADIGIIGMTYMFGVVGVVLYAIQFRWGLRRAPAQKNQDLAHTTAIATLIYVAVSSIATGQFMLFPETSLLMVVMVAAATGAVERRQPRLINVTRHRATRND
jgi:hypothetical protein